jgi:hypothetical protein
MGTVIRFPDERRMSWSGTGARPLGTPCSVVILPVIRVERHDDDPAGGIAPEAGAPRGSGRKRPARRS